MVFWWTVKISDSVALDVVGEPGTLEIPRVSALRKVLNAALLRRPTGEEPPNPERAPPDCLFALGSSRLPTSSQPDSLPENKYG